MKLEDMMDHYHVKDETIVPEESLSPEEKERILQLTLRKAGLTAPSAAQPSPNQKQRAAGRPSRRKYWTIAAACVVVLAMATVSFAAMALDKNFFSFFGVKGEEQSILLENLASSIDQSVTNNGTTLHVKEAVGDGNSVNVLFDLIAPEGTVLDQEYYNLGTAFIDLPKAGSMNAGYYFCQLPDDNPKDNKLTFMLCYDTNQNLSGQTMRFRFENLIYPKSYEETLAIEALPPREEPGTVGDEYDTNHLALSGVWNIEFPLEYKDSSTVVKPNADVTIEGNVCKVTKLRYSPISATMEIKGKGVAALDNGSGGTTDSQLEVLLKDGSLVTTNGTGTSVENNTLTITAQFSELIDPADIASIRYGDGTIQLP